MTTNSPRPNAPPVTASPVANPWTIADRGYALRLGGMAATLELATDTPGLFLAGDGSRGDLLLGIDLQAAATPVEHWLRGGDVTAVYEPADARRLRATAMWRATGGLPTPRDVAACELVFSAQTSVVESDASLAVIAEIDAAECLWSSSGIGPSPWTRVTASGPLPPAACCLLVHRRAAGTSTTVLVAVHPGDPRRIAVRPSGAGRTRVECRLFSSVIEKGVLLRSRVLAAVGPADSAPAWADDLVAAFAASPPMLDA